MKTFYLDLSQFLSYNRFMKILAIETSCDETSASVVEIKKNKKQPIFFILSNIVSSQIKIHQPYGGVVPELAARQHLKNILPIIDQSLAQAKVKPSQIDFISVVDRPGLISSLLIGLQTAQTLAYVWQKPLIKVDHVQAHLYANWLSSQKINFPALGLIVSGGHTQLILITNNFNFKIIGQTLDDAAGEAFDKIAKMLNLGYPGGPVIQKISQKGNPNKFNFPRALMTTKNFDFSFSGLKTSVLYKIKDLKQQKYNLKKITPDLAASAQQAIVDVLTYKTIKAAQEYQIKTMMLAGGVAANKYLRQQLGKKIENILPQVKFLAPDIQLCTDNAAMVAVAGYFKFLKNK